MDFSLTFMVVAYAAVIAFLLFVNFWPTVLAFRKGHPSRWIVLVLNLLVGWTGIGWLLITLWVLRAPSPEQSVAFLGAGSMKIPPPDSPPSA